MAKGDGAKRALTEREIDTGNGSFTIYTVEELWFHMWRALAVAILWDTRDRKCSCGCKGCDVYGGACPYCLHECGEHE